MRPAHSYLQNRILGYLEDNNVDSVSALASVIGSHRSSVSRAMHALANLGLARNPKGIWSITPKGKAELRRVQKQASERAQKTTAVARRLVENSAAVARSSGSSIVLTGNLDFSTGVTWNGHIGPLVDAGIKSAFSAIVGPEAFASVIESVSRAYDLHVSANDYGLSSQLNLLATDVFAMGTHEASLILGGGDVLQPCAASLLGSAAALKPLAAWSKTLDVDLNAKLQGAFANVVGVSVLANVDTLDVVHQQIFADAQTQVGNYLHVFDNLNADLYRSTLSTLVGTAAAPSFLEAAAGNLFKEHLNATSNVMSGIVSGLAQETSAWFSQSQLAASASMQYASTLGPEASRTIQALANVNLDLGTIMGDASQIAAQVSQYPEIALDAVSLLPSMTGVARSYTGHLGDLLVDLPRHNWPEVGQAAINAPTRAASAFVGSAKSILIADRSNDPSGKAKDPQLALWMEQSQVLDKQLQVWGPNMAAMWRGGWAVLNSDNPDQLRQAAHSSRELLVQALAILAPDNHFTADEIARDGHDGKITRRMRLRKIVGPSKSGLEFAGNMAGGLDSLYDRLTAVSHDRGIYPMLNKRQLAGLLHMLGGFLAYISGSID